VQVLVISVDMLNDLGTVVVVEITEEEPPDDPRVLVAVPLGSEDPAAGTVLCWRLSHANADRLDAASSPGQVSAATLERVVAGYAPSSSHSSAGYCGRSRMAVSGLSMLECGPTGPDTENADASSLS
jgi:mRNA-degrading endonuclease toxin of MazEF toxin-antitoxin module